MRIRIIKTPPGYVVDGADLRELRLNCVYDVEALLGAYFVIAGFAVGADVDLPKGPEVPPTTVQASSSPS
jgi:hypothetical protein